MLFNNKKIDKAIKHMKEKLRYCVASTAINKDVVELSIKGLEELKRANELRPLDEWGEEYGDCLWWALPIGEAPYCGTPLDSEFPDYVTHFTRLIVPDESEFDNDETSVHASKERGIVKKLVCIEKDNDNLLTVGNIYFATEETDEEYGIEIDKNFCWIKKELFEYQAN